MGGLHPYYVTGDYNVNFDYLTFPILFRRTFTGKINGFFNGGPFWGYLIRESKNYSQFDVGISGGFGISVPIKNKFSLSVEPRYNFGIYDITAKHDGPNGTLYTQSINFLLGFAYHFGVLPAK